MRRLPAVSLPFSVRLGGPHPLRFGTGRIWLLDWAENLPNGWNEDIRLFAGTWAAGFLAFSLFLS